MENKEIETLTLIEKVNFLKKESTRLEKEGKQEGAMKLKHWAMDILENEP